ncbi:pitrilysin family protein [Bacteroides sp. 519]|uniref:M16 family metallopeptidase n=1 Tax=Bacteroides sp. 519 TaxID=2302937 RepID=UPI0013D1837A|nr:M16 family metallopeptidase [Bacteroides sp. 519]NDV59312.1 insulinase family protein [Bacteroides sp. 519]
MKKLILVLTLLIGISTITYAQGLKAFKLKNGLSVFIWEDDTQSDVYGVVGVRAGSVNDPEQYTGLAHYLEHLMFKGTQKISTLNWEEEKPIYEQIIAKYDEMANEIDPEKKKAINAEINELTIAAAKVSVSNEYSNLMESMGAKDVNAGTSLDYTLYHNSFPAYQINKWLEISSQRFINPVFRTFQTELETVYEEYNRGQDSPGRALSEYIRSKAFEGHPYARNVLGLPEHLKNPRISELIKFYEDWYTPENMVLILVGNIKAEQISTRIAASFGKLPAKKTPERKVYPDLDIKGRKQYSAKVGNYPMAILVYPGVPVGHPDEKALKIALSLLRNNSGTGALDKLTIDGELMYGGASLASFREQGRCIVEAIPLYDQNQRRFDSNKAAEKKLLKAIEDVSNGKFDEWLIEAIKINMCRQYDLALESNENRADMLLDAFINEEELSSVLEYKEEIMAVTVDDIKRVAKQYLSDNYIALHTEKGKNDKKEKIQKPGFKPVEAPVGKQSLYGQQFKNMPIGAVEEKFMNFDEVQIKQINDRSKVFYTPHTENEVFTLTLKYGVGTKEYPKLGVAADLMNNAGVMGAFEPQELKKEFSRLNVTSRVSATKDYLTITMQGYEGSLAEACQLLARQILMPKLDDKQLNNIRGSILGARQQRKDNVQTLGDALMQYIRYQDNSQYIDELTDKEIIELSISELTGDINRASNYETEIHYTGSMPFETVYDILSKNLPLVANEKPSQSPTVTKFAEVAENTVYFLPNTQAEQAQIYFFMPTIDYNKENDVLNDAFYQYFSGSFNGLVLLELREKRSMVYTAYGAVATPVLPNHPSCFVGQIGTQNDKAIEALTLYMDLLRNMPENPERIDNIKSYLRQEALTSQPYIRYKSQFFEGYKRKGYTQDPAKENLPKIDALTFDDIVKYYKENIKDKPIAIGIMGNPKDINMDELKKFGKVVRLNEKKLFNSKDSFF